jgi:tetratricopeptide (TPR) repeat protein
MTEAKPTQRRSRRRLAIPVLLVAVVLVAFFLLRPVFSGPRAIGDASAEVVAATAAGDWQQVATLLDDVTPEAPSAVLRLIKGHAGLALNRNNDSLSLFLSASSDADLAAWEEWTGRLAAQQGRKATPHYLRGDALARTEQWDKALVAFGNSLRLQPDHALALNARGVVRASLEQWDEALVDLAQATEAAPSFADAYASRGALYIQKQTGAKGALKAFDQALAISPQFALALVGRGCAKCALGELDGAQADFEEAQAQTEYIAPLAQENLLGILAYIGLDPDPELVGLTKDELGTLIDKRFDAYFKNQNPLTRDNWVESLRVAQHTAPNEFGRALTTFRTACEVNPEFGRRAAQDMRDGVNTYRDTGWVHKFSATLYDAAETLGFRTRNSYQVVTQQRTGMRDTFKALRDACPVVQQSSRDGGVTADLSGAHMDEGKWPFTAYYGLLLDAQAVSHLAEEGAGQNEQAEDA